LKKNTRNEEKESRDWGKKETIRDSGKGHTKGTLLDRSRKHASLETWERGNSHFSSETKRKKKSSQNTDGWGVHSKKELSGIRGMDWKKGREGIDRVPQEINEKGNRVSGPAKSNSGCCKGWGRRNRETTTKKKGGRRR